MCGITGLIFDPRAYTKSEIDLTLSQQLRAILHRGPDADGTWTKFYDYLGIAFGHSRLSIQDLTKAGAQPMTSGSTRYTIVFNGEIYNHQLLRSELFSNNQSQIEWRGNSDTETVLACLDLLGITETLYRIKGMFAFAVWDEVLKCIYLARDRIGEKPLYYGWIGTGNRKCFIFGSELSSIQANSEFDAEIDRQSLELFVQYSYVPYPLSIYKKIAQLPPGTFLKVDKEGSISVPKKYWDIEEITRLTRATTSPKSFESELARLQNVLSDAVRSQMIADVPVGTFLSGGIDSSLITALAQSNSTRPIETFTIGFFDDTFNEAHYAKKIARHLGTSHNELYIDAVTAQDLITDLPNIYSEPFADSSQIPTAILCRFARSKVKVCLSGDGGDEVFGGYNRYMFVNQFQHVFRYLPRAIRTSLANLLQIIPSRFIETGVAKYPLSILNLHITSDRLAKLSNLLKSRDLNELYFKATTMHQQQGLVINPDKSHLVQNIRLSPYLPPIESMMAEDTVRYLPNDILTKIDRAAMSVGLETRTPYLDLGVLTLGWELPTQMKIDRGTTKFILRELLKKYIPEPLIDRPKMGFSIPLASWLRGPLKDWAESLLDFKSLYQDGYFDAYLVREIWNEHLSGVSNRQNVLWNILMFQAWLNNCPKRHIN